MIIPNKMLSADAMALFGSLDSVDVSEMTGQWAGRVIATGHPTDKLLEVSGWVGKRFDGADKVHPLIHQSVAGQINLNPGLISLGLIRTLRMAYWPLLPQLFYLIAPLLSTRRPRARLRMVSHHGVTSCAMIYDQKPIIDHFRRVDEQRVLGMMDFRGDTAPFFFLLVRQP